MPFRSQADEPLPLQAHPHTIQAVAFHPIDVIQHKRDGHALSNAEIEGFIRALVERKVPTHIPTDAQTAALLMAILLRGLDAPELAALTQAMRFSGEVFDPVSAARVHSGQALDRWRGRQNIVSGCADMSQPLPACTSDDLWPLAGPHRRHAGQTRDHRGLSHPLRWRSSSPSSALRVCHGGADAHLVPADRTLYALRDRSGTVESPYLIAACIMSKKLAEG